MSHPDKPRALMVIGSLGPGGAERVLAGVAGKLAAHGLGTTVLTASRPSTDFYSLAPGVRRVTPALERNRLLKLFRFKSALMSSARQSDVIVSFLTETNVAACIAGLLMRKPVVVSERIHPAFNSTGTRKWLFRLALQLYRWPGVHLVVQSEGIADAFRASGLNASVIPNGVYLPPEVDPWESRSKNVVVVGSLSERKRVSDALHAWARSGIGKEGWRMNILGDGPLRIKLEDLASSLKIQDSVDFIGQSSNVAEFLSKSRIYVSCSAYEGTSNALLEAMACGCACVVSDCPGDNRHLIRPEQGLLFPVGDVDTLAGDLKRLAEDETVGAGFGSRARLAARSRDWHASIQAWCDLIESTSPTRAVVQP